MLARSQVRLAARLDRMRVLVAAKQRWVPESRIGVDVGVRRLATVATAGGHAAGRG